MNEWVITLLDQPIVWILGGMAVVAVLLYLAQSVLVLIGGTALGLFFYQRYKKKEPDLLLKTIKNTLIKQKQQEQPRSLKESMTNLQTPSQKRWSSQFESLLES